MMGASAGSDNGRVQDDTPCSHMSKPRSRMARQGRASSSLVAVGIEWFGIPRRSPDGAVISPSPIRVVASSAAGRPPDGPQARHAEATPGPTGQLPVT